MADKNTFTIIISAVDAASATLRGIKREMRESFAAAPVVKLGRSLASLAEETGLASVAHHAANAAKDIVHLGGSIVESVLKPLQLVGGASLGLGMLAGAGSLVGIIDISRKASESMAELGETSEKIGIDPEQLARWRYAAKQSGVEAGTLDKAMEMFNRNIATAASGRNKPFLAYLQKMHIGLHDANGSLKDAAHLMPEVFDKFKANNSIVMKSGAAFAFMGRMGKDLIPFMDKGSASATKFGDEMDKFYGPVTKARVAVGEQATEAWRRFDLASQGLTNSIGIALAPAITRLIGPLSDWIANNRQLISDDVGAWAKKISDYLAKIDWTSLQNNATTFVTNVGIVAKDTAKVLVALVDMARWLEGHSPKPKKWTPPQAAATPDERAQAWRREALSQQYYRTFDWLAHPFKSPVANYVASPLGLIGALMPKPDPNFPQTMPDYAGLASRFPHLGYGRLNRDSSPIFGPSLFDRLGDRSVENGKMKITVDFLHAPPGMRITGVEKTPNIESELNTGLNWGPGF